MVKTNRSTLHTVYNIQQSATQDSNDTTHRLSRRTATTRFSPEGIGCQKQARFCQQCDQVGLYLEAFTRWRHLSTRPINKMVSADNLVDI